jgi:hypothetical protein
MSGLRVRRLDMNMSNRNNERFSKRWRPKMRLDKRL